VLDRDLHSILASVLRGLARAGIRGALGTVGVDDLGRFGLVLVDLGLLTGRDQQDPVTLVGLGEGDAHGGAALGGNLGHLGADHAAALHHHEQLVGLLDDRRTDQVAAIIGELRDADAQAATALQAVLIHAGALGEAAVGHGDHEGVGTDHVHREQLVVVAELHAGDAAGGAARRAQHVVGGGHAHALAVAGDEQQLIVAVHGAGSDDAVGVGAVDPVDVAEIDRDDAAGAVGVEGGHRRLLDQAGLGGEHQVLGVLVGVDREDGGDVLIGLEGHEVRDVLALRVPRCLGQLVALGAVDPALVGEEQQPAVRGRGEEVLDHVVLAQGGVAHSLAAALLGAVLVLAGAL